MRLFLFIEGIKTMAYGVRVFAVQHKNTQQRVLRLDCDGKVRSFVADSTDMSRLWAAIRKMEETGDADATE